MVNWFQVVQKYSQCRGGNQSTVMVEAVLPGYGKIYFAFLIHVANEIQLSSIYLFIACSELRKIFLRI